MWLLPTRERLPNLRRFLAAAREMGTSTPGLILVNRDELQRDQGEYAATLQLGPPGWQIRAVDADCYGEALRQAWPWVKDDAWIGLVSDDLIPASPGWDVGLVRSLQGWNVVSANDGWQANADIRQGRLHGAICWSGDLARAVGWVFPEGLRHIFHDDVWEALGRETRCWQTRMDIMTRHAHESLGGVRGPTMDPTSDLWRHDEAWFKDWYEGARPAVVQRIKALMDAKGVRFLDLDLRGLDVMIATPSASGRPEMSYFQSLLNTWNFLHAAGATSRWVTECYTADISLARMKLIGAFLRSTATHLLMIDDDMGWGDDALAKLFHAKKDFVAIAGPKKRYPLDFAASHTEPDGTPIFLEYDAASGTNEISEIGGAFVLLTRKVVERLAAAYPELRCTGQTGETEYALFNPLIADGRHFSEDFAFCRRWRALGEKIYMVPDVKLKHTGSHCFEGSFAEVTMQRLAEQGLPYFQEAAE